RDLPVPGLRRRQRPEVLRLPALGGGAGGRVQEGQGLDPRRVPGQPGGVVVVIEPGGAASHPPDPPCATPEGIALRSARVARGPRRTPRTPSATREPAPRMGGKSRSAPFAAVAYHSSVASSRLPSLGRRGEGWVVAQAMLLGLVAVAEILGPRWARSIADVVFAPGLVLLAAGALLFVAGIVALGPALTPLPLPRERASLREGGAYGLVRHPIYGAVILMVAGWSLIATPVGLAMTVLVGIFFELKSRREEEWLLARYPGYEDYRRRVRWKFLPGLR